MWERRGIKGGGDLHRTRKLKSKDNLATEKEGGGLGSRAMVG